MFKQLFGIIILLVFTQKSMGQEVVKYVLLREVNVSAGLDSFDTQSFINKVKSDTTFYFAFKSMNYYPAIYAAWLKVFKSGEKEKGDIDRIAERYRQGDSMWVEIKGEKINGKIKNRKGEYKYMTAEAWDEVFFPLKKQKVNLNSQRNFEKRKGESAAVRHRTEVKQMMFNPGNPVNGVPLIGKKMGIFEEEMQKYYNFSVYPGFYKDTINCLIFEAEVKPDFPPRKTVLKNLVTYFDEDTFEVMKRNYTIRYFSLPIDFDISIEIENQRYKNVLLPERIYYKGFFDIPFMKKESIEFELKDFNYLF